MRVTRILPLLAGVLLLSACFSPGPLPLLTADDVPAGFEQPKAENAPVWPSPDWWRSFQSAELDSLVNGAQAGNLTLAAAAARVLQADARIRQAGSPLLPFVSLSGDSGRSLASNTDSFGAGLGARYEIDLWNRNRNTLLASMASASATRADRETVALTAVSSVANTYFLLLSLRERLAIARLNLEAAMNVLTVTETRVRNGVATPLELAQQRAAIAGQQAGIPVLEQQALEARSALALLLGRPPEGFDVAGSDVISLGIPEIAPGLPSELLERRPDIATAEAALAAAHANIQVARAALFPSIVLTANGGVRSTNLADLVANPVSTLTFGATLAQTVFDAGRLFAITDEVRAREQELLANYRNIAITAFAEVENTLGAIANFSAREVFLTEQVAQAQIAFDIATSRYREGIADFLIVLETQRALYGARDARAQVRLARLLATVGLYRALGGGWQTPAPVYARG
jgi:outer membrane protein, multidrug efflux system